MVRRRNLRPDPRAAIQALKQRADTAGSDKDTVPAGIKDLGESGDVQWSETTGDGETITTSVRSISGDLAAAQQRIDDAETIIQGAQADIDQAKTDAAAAQSRLDAPDAALAGSIAAAMTTETKKLIVTEQAVLQHATLLGTTVVEQINIAGKLVGNDGVFKGTVDFANVNVTGTQIVNKLGANSIDASKINGDSFTGKTFLGLTMTGGIMRTSENPFTDGGVQIDATYGIRGWAPGSRWQDPTFQVNPSNGTLSMAANANFTDPTTKNGLVISPQTSKGNAALFFGVNQDTGANAAAIWRDKYTGLGSPLNLRGANGSGVQLNGSTTLVNSTEFQALGTVYLSENGKETDVMGRLWVLQDQRVSGDVEFAKSLTVYGSTIGANARFEGIFYNPGMTTSGSSANIVVDSSNGRIYRSTSSRRYKKYIKDWTPNAATVLALQPRTWEPKVDNDGAVETTANGHYVGFIAEEVDALGLTELVSYSLDADGNQQPESLNYDRFAAAQQVVLRDHNSRIQQLENRLAVLEEGATHGTA